MIYLFLNISLMTQLPLQIRLSWISTFEKTLGIPNNSSIVNKFDCIFQRNYYLICLNTDLFVFRINRRASKEEINIDGILLKKLNLYFLSNEEIEYSLL